MTDAPVPMLPCDATEPILVPRAIVAQFHTITMMLEDFTSHKDPIPLPNVRKQTFERILEYCEHYHENFDPETKISYITPGWEKDYCTDDEKKILDMTIAANFLAIPPLLKLLCKTIAGWIKGLSPEEIRTRFHIVNDFTPEEEAEIKREAEWSK